MLVKPLSSDDSQSRQTGASSSSDAAADSSSIVSGGGFDSDTSSGDSSSDDENICETINFIREKQSLLQRAAQVMRQEEAFNAANAVKEATVIASKGFLSFAQNAQTISSSPSSEDDENEAIWREAATLLTSLMSPDEVAALDSNRTVASQRKRCLPNPSHPLIENSHVNVVMATSYEAVTPCPDPQFLTTLPSTVFGTGQVRRVERLQPCFAVSYD